MLLLMNEKDVNSLQRLRVSRDKVAPSLFPLPIRKFCAVMWLMECVLWCNLLQGETPGEENPVSQEGVPTGYEAVSLIEAVNGPCNQFFSVDGGKLYWEVPLKVDSEGFWIVTVTDKLVSQGCNLQISYKELTAYDQTYKFW